MGRPVNVHAPQPVQSVFAGLQAQPPDPLLLSIRRTLGLRTGDQRSAAHRALNPQGLVQVIETDGAVFAQSGAILAMAQVVGCDIHPLNNLRVLQQPRGSLGACDQQVADWIGLSVLEGLGAVDRLIAEHGGAFAFGDQPTLADCYLVPQIYLGRRFSVDFANLTNVLRVDQHAAGRAAFVSAHPDVQTDAGLKP